MSVPVPTSHRAQIATYGKDVLRICQIELPTLSESDREICGAFLFGIVFAHGMLNRLNQAEVHALVIAALQDVLRYDLERARAFSLVLIQATKTASNPRLNSTIHRGIDGHRQLTSGQNFSLQNNFLRLFQTHTEKPTSLN
jgi:hypothetical protein